GASPGYSRAEPNREENLTRLANCNPRETTGEGAYSRAHSQHSRGCTEFCPTCKRAKHRAGEDLRECNLAETRDRPDADEKGKTGSRELRYKACMTERGEIEF